MSYIALPPSNTSSELSKNRFGYPLPGFEQSIPISLYDELAILK